MTWIDPVLLHIGPFEIRYYGLVYALGVLLVYWLLWKNSTKIGLPKEKVDDFILIITGSMIVGARLFEVIFWEPEYYLTHPLEILAIWKGGLSFHGGFIGLTLAVYYLCKKWKLQFYKIADFLVIPITGILAVGRIANFINGELVGTITNASWCVNFPNFDGCRHPVQIYEAITRGISTVILYKAYKKEHTEGTIFWLFVLLLGIGRFFLDFYREDTLYIGLSMGQYLSSLMIIIGSYILFKKSKKKK